MFKILKGDGIKTTTFRTFGLNSVMYADRAWSEPLWIGLAIHMTFSP